MAQKTSNNYVRRKKRFSSKSSSRMLQEEPKFLCSVTHYKNMPKPVFIEYCVMGRSNVGKSSFINHVLEKSNLARVSKTPGKTGFANFYKVNNKIAWVDLPGYGYAKASRSEKLRWSRLISDYCTKRENLFGIIWLIDIRHVGLKADVEAYNWLCRLAVPIFPVITKSDKLTQSKRLRNVREIEMFFQFNSPPVVYTIDKHASRKQFWKSFTIWQEAVEKNRR